MSKHTMKHKWQDKFHAGDRTIDQELDQKLIHLKHFETKLKTYKKNIQCFVKVASDIQGHHKMMGKTLHIVYEGSPYESAINESANVLSEKDTSLVKAESILKEITEIIDEVSTIMTDAKSKRKKYDTSRIEYDHY